MFVFLSLSLFLLQTPATSLEHLVLCPCQVPTLCQKRTLLHSGQQGLHSHYAGFDYSVSAFVCPKPACAYSCCQLLLTTCVYMVTRVLAAPAASSCLTCCLTVFISPCLRACRWGSAVNDTRLLRSSFFFLSLNAITGLTSESQSRSNYLLKDERVSYTRAHVRTFVLVQKFFAPCCWVTV